ncbi:ubinuclein-2 [Diorhabda carinulata]|uniref:ubinuclein-2 n=1 Tax=Diorhabda carinulata TaxID=1163345 RepID=UPI0025A0C418|nr:ubinuclein-2 [Diorhabda carinulata]
MSDIKRVALTTLEPQKVNDKVIKKLCKTVRISVILPESNEDNCPEYNYKDQLAAVVKRKTKPVKDTNGLENGLDPFGDNDDDVRRIALEMEAKYGSGVTKKKRKDRKDDYADIGMGYDESDSFIDNTDGYDEIIPKNVTTLHGGFYVNSGALEFKTDDEASSDASTSASSSSGTSSASESEGEDKQKNKNRKRILETSADSDSDTANPAQKEKKLKVQSPTTSMQQAIKKKMFSTAKIQVKKRKSIDPNKTVKDLLREKREDLNLSVPDELKTVEDTIEKESSKENKKPMNITSVTDAIESVLKQVVEDFDTKQNKSPAEDNVNNTQNKIDTQLKDKDKPTLSRLEKEEIVKLPENLPGDIDGILTKLKEAAINYKGEGKKAFFTQEVNGLLLNLEKKSRIISKSSRVKVYEHLAQYVNCTKDTLIRRARVLDLEDNERRLRNLKTKLKDCIDTIMPALEENFRQESQKVMEKKFSKENENDEEWKNLKLPKRKFRWNEETKKHLKDVVSVKKRCLVLEGNKASLLEEQLVDYLRKDILPLWPENWMYINNIKKILNSMQGHSRSSSSSNPSNVSVDSSKHSNISITPITNGKNDADKTEITNSITVTKVVNNNEIVLDNKKIDDTEEQSKSNESQSKIDSNDEVFKPYAEMKKIYAKTHEMFKPYADEIKPEKKFENNKEIVPQYMEKEKTSENIRSNKQDFEEKEKYPGKSYHNKDKHHHYHDKNKHHHHHHHHHLDKDKRSYTDKDVSSKYVGHNYGEKLKHPDYTYNTEKEKPHSYTDKQNRQTYPDKEKPEEKPINRQEVITPPIDLVRHVEKTSKSMEKPIVSSKPIEKPIVSSKPMEKPIVSSKCVEKPTDLSKFQMFKPYSDTPKSVAMDDLTVYQSKDVNCYKPLQDEKYHSNVTVSQDLTNKFNVPVGDFVSTRCDVSATKHRTANAAAHCYQSGNNVNDLSSMLDDSGVIVKNLPTREEKKENPPTVIPTTSHCQGVKKKLLETYSRNPNDINSSNHYSPVFPVHQDYVPHTPLVTSKSDGDGQKDIQMVMENLKALQKLACSPVKNDNSSNSPVSVIAYNKSFSSSKTTSNHSHGGRNDVNSRGGGAGGGGGGDFASGFQDEFQKAFINSLQQMAANKSSYNNGS